MYGISKTIVLGATAVGLAACSSGPYTPILDGAPSAAYQKDLAECRQVSLQRQGDDGAVLGSAVIGGVLGGLVSEEGSELEGALIGAALGGAEESLDQKAETLDAQDRIVFNCLRGRGHNVVG